ncbi:Acyl-CoA dehydrogenase [Plantibacter flavus]|uniref:Dibenzothiophene monooxygenase n=1 Tax=Plantibacter flavus TaxID=150123 RepID=A0A3N2C6G7_9MICO|nr:acyl-CoA dehydrogenase family protein [Plantibacter flavus]ROR83105.1 alkylation response protein AidB-like acyl-CoA dehydrogenase [Plantibacter flavus]SMG46345.1 Acyl-CoA dehydrogenase [Plantibacter flavus]
MTSAPSTTARPVGFSAARELLLPLFAEIQAGAVERELEHRLPREEVRKLAAAGFGALRVPTEFGGSGLTFPEFTELLIELAAADSNLPQIFRGHIALVEDQLVAAPSDRRTAWLERFVAGEIVGNAWSEVGSGALGVSGTVVTERAGRYVVNGRKFYTTGSIYADWTDATARLVVEGQPDTEVTVLVRTNQLGVTIADDWDGFGQQLTGTGTIVFEDAVVDADQLHPFTDRFRYQTALYQHVLIAVHAGIAAAVERDAGEQIRARTRVYTHGLAPLVKDDGQIQAVVGEISSIAFVAKQTVLGVAAAIERASETAADRDSADDLQANIEAEIRSAQAQVVLSELVPRAATLLFNTLGASAVSRTSALDRHWRNARTVASHNPVIYKTRIVGDWSINGTPPPFVWAVGTAKPQ